MAKQKTKNELLRGVIYYHWAQQKELEDNGDTMQRRRLIGGMVENVKQYRESGGRYIDSLDIYQPIVELYNEYYEELIFTPCVEDLQEMKYWI